MSTKVIQDKITDLIRAIDGLFGSLKDGFQFSDLMRIVAALADDEDNPNGTVVDGFIRDLPELRREISQYNLSDSTGLFLSIRDEVGPVKEGSVKAFAVDVVAYLLIGQRTIEDTIEALQRLRQLFPEIGTGIPADVAESES